MTNATGFGVKFIPASCRNNSSRTCATNYITSPYLPDDSRGGNLDERVIGFIADDSPIILFLKGFSDGRWNDVEKFGLTLNHERVAAVFQRKRDMRICSDIPRLDRIAPGANKRFFIEPDKPNRDEMRRTVGTDGGKPDISGSF